MFRSGWKNSFRLFSSLLLALMVLAGIAFIVPGALTIGDLNSLVHNPGLPVKGMGVLGAESCSGQFICWS